MYTHHEIVLNRETWCQALRSDKYHPGPGRLKAVNADGDILHCCLGVACELPFAKLLGVEEAFAEVEDYNAYYDDEKGYFTFDDSDAFLPSNVAETLGLSHDSQCILSTLNDKGVGFSIIAEVIQYLPIDLLGEE